MVDHLLLALLLALLLLQDLLMLLLLEVMLLKLVLLMLLWEVEVQGTIHRELVLDHLSRRTIRMDAELVKFKKKCYHTSLFKK